MASKFLLARFRFALGRVRAQLHRAVLRLAISGWTEALIRVRRTRARRRPEFPRDRPAVDRRSPLILVVDVGAPTPDRDSGSVRLIGLLKTLKQAGLHPIFTTDDFQTEGPELAPLLAAGVAILPCRNALEAFQWMEDHRDQLIAIIACRHYTACHWLAAAKAIAPAACRVFDSVDLHFLREQREALVQGRFGRARLAELTRRRELQATRLATTTWVVSPLEKEIIDTLAPRTDVRIVSNVMEPLGETPGFDQRRGLLFVGGFRHSPNVDAVAWLLTEIFPLVKRAAPEIELDIVGSDMPFELQELADRTPGVRQHGYVRDITPLLLRGRVGVAPLRFGAGVKGKINSSMAHGQPVVATACATEGMHLTHDANVLIADDAGGFAQQVVRLYRDARLWNRLVTAGRENVETYFSPTAALDTMMATFRAPRISSPSPGED